MKEGFWIHAKTGQSWKIHEHALFAQSVEGAKSMGLPESVRQAIAAIPHDFNGPKRKYIVTTVCQAGYIRLRGHGTHWTFEFWNQFEASLFSVLLFTKDWAGPFTGLNIHDLKNNLRWSGSFQEFSQIMAKEGPQGLMPQKHVDETNTVASIG